jgi:hypothetical protein
MPIDIFIEIYADKFYRDGWSLNFGINSLSDGLSPTGLGCILRADRNWSRSQRC